MTRGTLILVRGLPGAGKSTFSHMYRNQLIVAGIGVEGPFEADQYFEDPETGAYNFDATKLGQAHSQCQEKTRDALQRGIAYVIVSNTFTTERELTPYTDMANQLNYSVISLVVENRHGNESIHNVPEEAMDRMRNRFSVKL